MTASTHGSTLLNMLRKVLLDARVAAVAANHHNGTSAELQDRVIEANARHVDEIDEAISAIDTSAEHVEESAVRKVPDEWKAVVADLASLVRIQNGNQHDDVNSILARADSLLAADLKASGAQQE